VRDIRRWKIRIDGSAGNRDGIDCSLRDKSDKSRMVSRVRAVLAEFKERKSTSRMGIAEKLQLVWRILDRITACSRHKFREMWNYIRPAPRSQHISPGPSSYEFLAA